MNCTIEIFSALVMWSSTIILLKVIAERLDTPVFNHMWDLTNLLLFYKLSYKSRRWHVILMWIFSFHLIINEGGEVEKGQREVLWCVIKNNRNIILAVTCERKNMILGYLTSEKKHFWAYISSICVTFISLYEVF